MHEILQKQNELMTAFESLKSNIPEQHLDEILKAENLVKDMAYFYERKQIDLIKEKEILEDSYMAECQASFCFSNINYADESFIDKSRRLDSVKSGGNPYDQSVLELDQTLISKQSVRPKDDLDFMFLFASPLVNTKATINSGIGVVPIVWEIDYMREVEAIRNVLQDLTCEVKFMSSVASLDSITSNLSKNPCIIHFCGHGVQNNQKNFGAWSRPGDGDCLLFEDKCMKSEYVTSKSISE